MNWRPAAYAAAAILVGFLYVKWCHDPAVRKEVRLQDAGRVTDSTAAVTDRRVARLVAESLELGARLLRSERAETSALTQIRRLRLETVQRDSVSNNDSVRFQLAVRDSMIVGLQGIVAGQDSSIGLYQAMLAARDTVMLRLIAERAAYRMERDSWQKVAQPGILTRVGRALPYLAAGYVLAKLTR